MADNNPRLMGRIGAAYGIKGYLKVKSFTEQPENLFDYSPWFIRQRGEDWREVQVEAWKPYQEGFIVKLTAVETPEAAKLLSGSDVGIKRSSLPPAPEGRIYLCDLVGCKVIGLEGVYLGQVLRVVDQGAAPLLEVSPSDLHSSKQSYLLIPYVNGPIIRKVDLAERTIWAEWGEDY